MTDKTRTRDKEIFRLSDNIMSGSELEGFLRDLETEQVFWNKGVTKVAKLIGFFGTESNQYAEPRLRERCDNMCHAFVELTDFLICQSHSLETLEFTADDTKLGLSMRADADTQQLGIELSQERLHRLTGASRGAYTAYRAAVKETLSL